MTGGPKIPLRTLGAIPSGAGKLGHFHTQLTQGANNGNWPAYSSLYGNTFIAPSAGYFGAFPLSTVANNTFTAFDLAKSIPDEGIRAGEVIGWRFWRLEGGQLQSVVCKCAWEPGVPVTGDPGDDYAWYGEGVHAFKTVQHAWEDTPNYRHHYVFGSVDMWGKIVEHEYGYRAEYAAVRSIESAPGRLLGPLKTWLLRRMYLNDKV